MLSNGSVTYRRHHQDEQGVSRPLAVVQMVCLYCQGKDTQRHNKHHCPPEYAKGTGRKRIVGQRSDRQGPIPYVLPKQAWRNIDRNTK